MKIAILLLCHEPPALLAKQISSPFFRHPDIKLYIHYDASRKTKQLEQLRGLIPSDVKFMLTPSRVRCAWGEYSLVQATALLMQTALEDGEFGADYLYLVSGSCTPIRPASSLIKFLKLNNGTDFIESVDISKNKWVLDGNEQERYELYHPFNFRTQRAWFDRFNKFQRRLGIRKLAPNGLNIHFGSQWFTITKNTSPKNCCSTERSKNTEILPHQLDS
ncbi:MAG: beta-1,6-N-acetylglucosaminyltransferase [Ideonella sp.]|nr:beta-1,6-N-acetylglucosaminyltransferase [Ideonella sp.]